MVLRYANEKVTIRPFASAKEAAGLRHDIYRDVNMFWGPSWYAPPEISSDFAANGLMDPTCMHQFAVDDNESGELIGVVQGGLSGNNTVEGWFGTFIHPDRRNRGFGIAAKQLVLCYMFEAFPVNRMMSDTLAHHAAARKGMERCGVKHEGNLRAARVIDGKWYDLSRYSILRCEWEQAGYRSAVKRGQ